MKKRSLLILQTAPQEKPDIEGLFSNPPPLPHRGLLVVYLCIIFVSMHSIAFWLYLDDVTNAVWNKWGLVILDCYNNNNWNTNHRKGMKDVSLKERTQVKNKLLSLLRRLSQTATTFTQDKQQSLTPSFALQLCSFPWHTAAIKRFKTRLVPNCCPFQSIVIGNRVDINRQF